MSAEPQPPLVPEPVPLVGEASAGEAPKKSSKTWLIVLIVVVVLCCLCAIVVAIVLAATGSFENIINSINGSVPLLVG
jgi:hypothetical protein